MTINVQICQNINTFTFIFYSLSEFNHVCSHLLLLFLKKNALTSTSPKLKTQTSPFVLSSRAKEQNALIANNRKHCYCWCHEKWKSSSFFLIFPTLLWAYEIQENIMNEFIVVAVTCLFFQDYNEKGNFSCFTHTIWLAIHYSFFY